MGKNQDKIITSFSALVEKEVSPCRIFLFGSRATKKFKKDSDYDFLLVSPQFKKWEWEKRLAKMYLLKKNIPAAMDIICLTPEEFEKKRKQVGVIQEAAKKGIEIKAG